MKIQWINILFLFLISCNGSNTQTPGASHNIQESKEIGVFIEEYNIINIQTIDTTFLFPIQTVWKEMIWHVNMTKSGKDRTPIIDSTYTPRIVVSLKINSSMKLTIDNYLTFWQVQRDGEGSVGCYNNMIVCSSPKEAIDTIPFTIYRCSEPYSFENLTPLFTFDLVKKE